MRIIIVTLFKKKWTPVLKSRFDSVVLREQRSPLRTISIKKSDQTLMIVSDSHTIEIISNLKNLQDDYTFPSFLFRQENKEGWKDIPKRIQDPSDCFKITKSFCASSLRRMLKGEA